MLSGHLVVDADAHVMEPDEMWSTYIDRRFRGREPRRQSSTGEVWGQMVVDGVPIYRAYPQELSAAFDKTIRKNYPDYLATRFDAPSTIAAMDRQGIDHAWLYPSLGLGVLAIDGMDKGLAAGIAQAYNNWLHDYCTCNPLRLRQVAVVSLHDPNDAVAEVKRAANDLGVKAVTIRPNPIRGRHIGSSEFQPFWAACEDLQVAVGIHEGCHTKLPAAGADRFDTHFAMHSCCHPMEQIMAFVALVQGGVFERHPDLRVAFLEAGCGWVPYFLWRTDEEYRLWKFQVPDAKRRPSDYFRRQCYVGMEGCEPCLNSVISFIGEDRLLFASDYPHPDHGFGEEIQELKTAQISDTAKHKILSANAMRFYGMKETLATSSN